MEQHQSQESQQSTLLDKKQAATSQRQSSKGEAAALSAEDNPAEGTGDKDSEEGRS